MEVSVTGGGCAREAGGTLSTLTLPWGARTPLAMAHMEAVSLTDESRCDESLPVSGCP